MKNMTSLLCSFFFIVAISLYSFESHFRCDLVVGEEILPERRLLFVALGFRVCVAFGLFLFQKSQSEWEEEGERGKNLK